MNKDIYDIADEIAYQDFKAYLTEDKPVIIAVEGYNIETEDAIFEVSHDYRDLIELVSEVPEFDISSYSTGQIENQGYVFKTF